MNLIPRSNMFEIDHPFSEFFRGFPTVKQEHGLFEPRVDVRERDDAYEITAELPGVDKDDLQVTLENGLLTIEGTIEDESSEEKEGKVVRRERRYGQYSRGFNVGSGVSEADIAASFRNGVLTLTVPKKETPAPQAKRISIK